MILSSCCNFKISRQNNDFESGQHKVVFYVLFNEMNPFCSQEIGEKVRKDNNMHCINEYCLFYLTISSENQLFHSFFSSVIYNIGSVPIVVKVEGEKKKQFNEVRILILFKTSIPFPA